MSSDIPDVELLTDSKVLAPMIGPPNTALLVIDVQNDFVAPAGAARSWGVDFSRFESPLKAIQALIGAARSRSVATVFARVVTRPETDSVALSAFHARLGHSPDATAICRAGTSGADYYRVKPQPGDIEVEKPLYSCFVGTELDARLRARGIDTLVLTGFTTDCCVDCTARDAFHRNYNVFIVADACAAYESHLHDGALNGLSRNCALLTSSQAVQKAWSA